MGIALGSDGLTIIGVGDRLESSGGRMEAIVLDIDYDKGTVWMKRRDKGSKRWIRFEISAKALAGKTIGWRVGGRE